MAEQPSPVRETRTLPSSPQAHDTSPAGAVSEMKQALSGFLAARVELASLEAKEAASFAVKKVVYGVILAISAFFLWCITIAALTGILAPHASRALGESMAWLPGWCAVLLVFALLHGILALICGLRLKKKSDEQFFALSRQELENDKQWLKKKK